MTTQYAVENVIQGIVTMKRCKVMVQKRNSLKYNLLVL